MMKTKTLLMTSALSSLLLFLPGCLDIYLTTQLFPNGEVEKTIVIKGDSTDIPNAPFFFMQDSGWSRKWTEGDEEGKKNLVLSRHFRSVRELNKAMNPPDTTLMTIRVQSTLKRQFRWFFTYLEYSETILRADPFKTHDWREFLTEEELRLIKISDEEKRKADPGYNEDLYKKTEENYLKFIMRSTFDSFMNSLKLALASGTGNQNLDRLLSSHREDLFQYLVDSTKSDDADSLLMALDNYFNTKEFSQLSERNPEPFLQFNDKTEFNSSLGVNSYKFIIRMPGLLMKTTSTQIQGVESRWELAYEDFYFDDYTMSCESRIINKWAFWVAGAILLLALGSFVLAVFRRISRHRADR